MQFTRSSLFATLSVYVRVASVAQGINETPGCARIERGSIESPENVGRACCRRPGELVGDGSNAACNGRSCGGVTNFEFWPGVSKVFFLS